MKVTIQRVSQAHVIVDQMTVGKIAEGLLVFLGVSETDDLTTVKKIADKIINLRIFNDDLNKMNLSLLDICGSLLIVSQFTLYADCTKGNRPNFLNAANSLHAKKIYNEFVNYMVQKKINVQSGQFGAHMEVHLINSGPATFILTIDS
mgnify:FL=1|tara:strand:- start:301 stop:744 length:444 start_codon:yes stop_codon:yes gene_type:complete